MIPKHCIEFFVDKFSQYPSFVSLETSTNEEVLKKLTPKTKTIWVNKAITDDKKIIKEQFLEYDSSGIMIYIKDDINLTFVCQADKIQNVELLLSQLKRIKK